MVARYEHLRYRAPLPQLGAGILRILEQALCEALLSQRLTASYHARDESHAGVDQRDRRGLPTGEDEVAEAQFLDPPRLQHTLVNPLEATANQGHPWHCSKLADPLLIEPASPRRH